MPPKSPKTGWTIPLDIKLIKNVRQRPASWKKGSVGVERNLSWRDIGKAMNKSPGSCKMRFETIRINNGRATENVKNNKAKRFYKYHDQLKFMDENQNGDALDTEPRTGHRMSTTPDGTENRPSSAASVHINYSKNPEFSVVGYQVVQNAGAVTNSGEVMDDDDVLSEDGLHTEETDPTELLIIFVRERVHLWDFRKESYRDRDMRANAWTKIAELMGKHDGSYWKKEWEKLVTTRRSHRKKYPSGSAAQNGIAWPFFDDMEFLDELPVARPTESNFHFDDDSVSIAGGVNNADESSNDASGLPTGKEKTVGSSTKPKSNKNRSSGCSADEEASAVATVFAEYFKHKKTEEKPAAVCAEARLVHDTMQRLDRETKIEFRTGLYKLLSDVEARNMNN